MTLCRSWNLGKVKGNDYLCLSIPVTFLTVLTVTQSHSESCDCEMPTQTKYSSHKAVVDTKKQLIWKLTGDMLLPRSK